MKKITAWANNNDEIDESQLGQPGDVRLENQCPCCGCVTLYAHKTVIGYTIQCASKGCDDSLQNLVKRAIKHDKIWKNSISNNSDDNLDKKLAAIICTLWGKNLSELKSSQKLPVMQCVDKLAVLIKERG